MGSRTVTITGNITVGKNCYCDVPAGTGTWVETSLWAAGTVAVGSIHVRTAIGKNKHSGQKEQSLWKPSATTVGRNNLNRQRQLLFMAKTIRVGGRNGLWGSR